MKSSSYTNNPNEERPLSITNKSVFKLPTTLPRRFASLQQSLTPETTASTNSSSLVSSHVLSIANTMKLRMKAAVNTMAWNGNRRNTPLSSVVSPSTATATVSNTPLSVCDLQHEKQQPGHHRENGSILQNSALLKQYITFVQEETGVNLDMDLSSTSHSHHQPTFETQRDHPSHSLASSGAALIESIVHHSTSIVDSENILDKTPTTKSVTPQRRTSRSIKSTPGAVALKMEEAEKQFKKSERLRQKQRRCKSRWTSLETAMISSNKAKKEYATPPHSAASSSTAAAAAAIRCICATPHEEFGSMVQCDDCTCWLHLECLALDENALDETFQCPSCSISLGPGQHLTSAVTWRVAAQLKSQRLANRMNTITPETVTNINKNNSSTKDKKNYKGKPPSYRRESDRQRRLHRSIRPSHHQYHYRSQQHHQHQRYQKERRRQHYRRPLMYSTQYAASSSSSSDNDDTMDKQQHHHRTWMIPKMTIHSSISTTMTTSTGNVLVQKLNNHRTPTTISSSNNYDDEDDDDGDDTDVDMEMAIDSDTTESDWESGARYQQYHHHQHQRRFKGYHNKEYDVDSDYDSQDDDTATSTWTRASFSSINTTPSLTLSPSHTGSDTDSPSEASTPPDERFSHDDTYMTVMNDNNNTNINTTTTSDSDQRMMLSTTATSACLDQESLLWLSRLAYLESLQSSTGQQCFTPHASDVFLCGDGGDQQKCNPGMPMMVDPITTTSNNNNNNNNNDTDDHHHYSQLTHTPLMASTRSDLPSTICSHDLSQFSFDAGPFWSPIH